MPMSQLRIPTSEWRHCPQLPHRLKTQSLPLLDRVAVPFKLRLDMIVMWLVWIAWNNKRLRVPEIKKKLEHLKSKKKRLELKKRGWST